MAIDSTEHFSCAVSPRTLRGRLHALGFRRKQSRYRYAYRATHLPQQKGALRRV